MTEIVIMTVPLCFKAKQNEIKMSMLYSFKYGID